MDGLWYENKKFNWSILLALLTIETIFVFSPLHYIHIEDSTFSLAHALIIACALWMGPIGGIIGAIVFSMETMWYNMTIEISAFEIINNPYISGNPIGSFIYAFVPSIFLGLVSGILFQSCSKNIEKKARIVFIFIGTLIIELLFSYIQYVMEFTFFSHLISSAVSHTAYITQIIEAILIGLFMVIAYLIFVGQSISSVYDETIASLGYTGRSNKELLFSIVIIIGVLFIVSHSWMRSIIRIYELSGKEVSQEIYIRYFGIATQLSLSILLAVIIIIMYKNHVSNYERVKDMQSSDLKESLNIERKTKENQMNFLASMSHDLRTPLHAIMGSTQIALKNKHDREKILDSLHKIELSSNHLLTLVNDILDYTQIESGKLTINEKPFELGDLIAQTVGIERPQIMNKKQHIHVDTKNIINESLIGDILRLKQVYINILSNAIKYTQEGGTIEVNISQKLLPSEEVELIVEIKDNGIGMKKEFVDHIFDCFSREVKDVINTVEGTGLGLSITKELVDSMHGTILVDSVYGYGSTFTVKIPLKQNNHIVYEDLMNSHVLVYQDHLHSLEQIQFVCDELNVSTAFVDKEEFIELAKKSDTEYDACILSYRSKHDIDTVGFNLPIIYVLGVTDLVETDENLNGVAYIDSPVMKASFADVLRDSKRYLQEEKNRLLTNNSASILIAEDNDMNYDIICELLEMFGYTCTRAINGEEAIRLFEENDYDIILMDIQMPVKNGYEATKEIRLSQKESGRNIPIIAMSANAFASDVEKSIQSGMDAHIAKPVDIEELVKEISYFVRKV